MEITTGTSHSRGRVLRWHHAAGLDALSSGFRCDGRKYCSQMTSCTEAKFYLKNCPGTQMDGNQDDVPCGQQWCTGPLPLKAGSNLCAAVAQTTPEAAARGDPQVNAGRFECRHQERQLVGRTSSNRAFRHRRLERQSPEALD
ncbi:excalibur calcium-binding domain-containing protein [Variovorax sp. J31P207]|uniref:excalibur calcium-binding domain-containing protein n=1 Tax=Variovorax sp. J31P207 TaxID=3053510 RepID=UPI0033656F8D